MVSSAIRSGVLSSERVLRMYNAVLVLNQDYQALSICSVERAVNLLLRHKAEMVAPRDGLVLRSPSITYPWPSVIRLKRYISLPYRKVALSRRNIMRRDGFRCQYCGSREKLTIDHVFPRSRGGRDTWENLVTACIPCNSRKGDRTPEEANMPLRRRPFRPSYVMFIRDCVNQIEDSWKPFLFLV